MHNVEKCNIIGIVLRQTMQKKITHIVQEFCHVPNICEILCSYLSQFGARCLVFLGCNLRMRRIWRMHDIRHPIYIYTFFSTWAQLSPSPILVWIARGMCQSDCHMRKRWRIQNRKIPATIPTLIMDLGNSIRRSEDMMIMVRVSNHLWSPRLLMDIFHCVKTSLFHIGTSNFLM